MTNENASSEKYTSHSLFSKGLRKGWCWLCVRGELETEQTATYWPQVRLYYNCTSSSFCWAAQRGSWGPKLSVWRWLSLQNLVLNCNWNSNWTLPASNSNWTQAVCGTWLYNCLMPTGFLWAYASAPNSTRPQVKVIFRYLRPDTPVSWLTAWSRVSILQNPKCLKSIWPWITTKWVLLI